MSEWLKLLGEPTKPIREPKPPKGTKKTIEPKSSSQKPQKTPFRTSFLRGIIELAGLPTDRTTKGAHLETKAVKAIQENLGDILVNLGAFFKKATN